jgi:hypothetical protein
MFLLHFSWRRRLFLRLFLSVSFRGWEGNITLSGSWTKTIQTILLITGSLFDLLGGSPSYGFVTEAGIALVGVPLCFFLFYAAIVKGQAETEEDDKKFRSGGF